jgi:hypothetical protein
MDDLRALGRMLTNSATQEVPRHGSAGFHSQPEAAAQQQAQPVPAAAAAPSLPQHAESAAAVTASAQPNASPDVVVSERQCGDGRLERVYASGLRVQNFPNGSRKQQWPDGRSATCFGNGDIKKAWPDGECTCSCWVPASMQWE